MTTSTRSSSLFAALLVACSIALWSGASEAGTAIKLDLESLVANSACIAIGEVTDVESFRKDGRILTDITFRIEQEWKGGDSERDRLTIRQPGGQVGDLITHVPGTPSFETGDRVVVFLEHKDRGFFVPTGLSQGVFDVATGPDASTRFVVPSIGDLNLVAPSDEAAESEVPSAPEHNTTLKTRLRAAEVSDIHDATMPLEAFRRRVQSTVRAQDSAP